MTFAAIAGGPKPGNPKRMSVATPAADRTSSETKRFLPWIVATALFMENLDATILNTAVPTMAASLDVAPLSLKAVLTSYTLCLAAFIPISGWMADRFPAYGAALMSDRA